MVTVARITLFLLAVGLAAVSRAAVLADPELGEALARGETRAVIVQLREDTPLAASATARATARTLRGRVKSALLARLPAGQVELRRSYEELPAFAATVRSAAALQRLLVDPEVEAVFADRPLRLYLGQALPLVGQPEVANTMGRQGAGTTVAVIDTGVDYTRPELGACSAPGAPAGCRVIAAYEAAAEDNTRDANGHGTLVAMTVAGIAPQARIAAIDAFDGNTGLSSDLIEAINWVIANQAALNIVALNMSLGDGAQNASPCSNRFTNPFVLPVRNARSAGVVVVAASGNEGHTNGISSPACVSEAMAVGAVYDANVGQVTWSACTDPQTAADRVTCFSSSGAPLDMLAPGALISVGGSTVGGTSFSAPMVAGAAAVLKSAFAGETVSQIEARLLDGPATTDARNGLVRPRLDLLRAQGVPANDAFAAAIVLTDSGATSGWNHNASSQSGEPVHAGVAGGRSVWWRWTAPADGRLQLSTAGSGLDTLLALYAGTALNALVNVAANDNAGAGLSTSLIEAAVVAGTDYRIAIDGKGGAQGALNLSHVFTPSAADLGLNLASAPASATVGTLVTLTATVFNAGPDMAKAVTLDLVWPAQLGAPLLLPAGCGQLAGGVRCDLGQRAAGSSVAVTLQATVIATGSAPVAAQVAAATTDPQTADNAASLVVTGVAPGGGGSDEGGGSVSDSDVPLPGWALVALGAALLGAGQRAQHRRARRTSGGVGKGG